MGHLEPFQLCQGFTKHAASFCRKTTVVNY